MGKEKIMKSITHNKLKTLSKYVQNFPIPVILGYGSTSRNRRLLIKDVEAKQLVLPIVVYAEEDGLIYVKPEKGENITYGVLQNIYTTMGEYFTFIIENKGGQDYAPSKIYMKSYKNIFGTPGVGGKKLCTGCVSVEMIEKWKDLPKIIASIVRNSFKMKV